eukprot:COSAG02_NODE_45825_length_353_cov_812.122047_1_plen_78_part_01
MFKKHYTNVYRYVRTVSIATVTELISENRVCPVLTNKFCLLVRSHYVQTVLFSHNKFWTAHNTLDILQNQSIVRYHTS